MTHPLGERRPFVVVAAALSIVLVIAASILLPAAGDPPMDLIKGPAQSPAS